MRFIFSFLFFSFISFAATAQEKPCDIELKNGERNAIFLMQTDPQSYLELSCRADDGSCVPFAPDASWEDTVRVKLRNAGCSMDLIREKMPRLMAEHCRMGITPACQ